MTTLFQGDNPQSFWADNNLLKLHIWSAVMGLHQIEDAPDVCRGDLRQKL